MSNSTPGLLNFFSRILCKIRLKFEKWNRWSLLWTVHLVIYCTLQNPSRIISRRNFWHCTCLYPRGTLNLYISDVSLHYFFNSCCIPFRPPAYVFHVRRMRVWRCDRQHGWHAGDHCWRQCFNIREHETAGYFWWDIQLCLWQIENRYFNPKYDLFCTIYFLFWLYYTGQLRERNEGPQVGLEPWACVVRPQPSASWATSPFFF